MRYGYPIGDGVKRPSVRCSHRYGIDLGINGVAHYHSRVECEAHNPWVSALGYLQRLRPCVAVGISVGDGDIAHPHRTVILRNLIGYNGLVPRSRWGLDGNPIVLCGRRPSGYTLTAVPVIITPCRRIRQTRCGVLGFLCTVIAVGFISPLLLAPRPVGYIETGCSCEGCVIGVIGDFYSGIPRSARYVRVCVHLAVIHHIPVSVQGKGFTVLYGLVCTPFTNRHKSPRYVGLDIIQGRTALLRNRPMGILPCQT